MGFLTESISRLRDEITKSRVSRAEFRKELGTKTAERRANVASLQAAFAHDLGGARLAWSGRSPGKNKRQTAVPAGKLRQRPESAPPRTAEQSKPGAVAAHPAAATKATPHKDRGRRKR